MAVIYFVFSLTGGDILILEKATHSFDDAAACVHSRIGGTGIGNSTRWFSILKFPTIQEYSVGTTLNVVVDMPSYDWANIRVIDVARKDQNILNQYGEDVWVDESVVS